MKIDARTANSLWLNKTASKLAPHFLLVLDIKNPISKNLLSQIKSLYG
jgi:hypothetical protein